MSHQSVIEILLFILDSSPTKAVLERVEIAELISVMCCIYWRDRLTSPKNVPAATWGQLAISRESQTHDTEPNP